MSGWLVSILKDRNVFQIVEPFWITQFKRNDVSSAQTPPFFFDGVSYQSWLSKFCRYLIQISCSSKESPWKKLFEACLSAVRAIAGVNVAEFLLPLFVLDVACFGDEREEEIVVAELERVLTWHQSASSGGGGNGNSLAIEHEGLRATRTGDTHRRAVNTVFNVLDTLEHWSESEKYHQKSSRVAKGVSGRLESGGDRSLEWPVEEGLDRISSISTRITLQIRASAATAIGAHARALKYLEMDARAQVAASIYDDRYVAIDDDMDQQGAAVMGGLGGAWAPIPRSDVGKVQMLFGSLNDIDNMAAE